MCLRLLSVINVQATRPGRGRAAERARRERERACGADMLGQSNMMSSFEQEAEEDDQSIFDEYGMGGF